MELNLEVLGRHRGGVQVDVDGAFLVGGVLRSQYVYVMGAIAAEQYLSGVSKQYVEGYSLSIIERNGLKVAERRMLQRAGTVPSSVLRRSSVAAAENIAVALN
jgi:hypothetical protein